MQQQYLKFGAQHLEYLTPKNNSIPTYAYMSHPRPRIYESSSPTHMSHPNYYAWRIPNYIWAFFIYVLYIVELNRPNIIFSLFQRYRLSVRISARRLNKYVPRRPTLRAQTIPLRSSACAPAPVLASTRVNKTRIFYSS